MQEEEKSVGKRGEMNNEGIDWPRNQKGKQDINSHSGVRHDEQNEKGRNVKENYMCKSVTGMEKMKQ